MHFSIRDDDPSCLGPPKNKFYQKENIECINSFHRVPAVAAFNGTPGSTSDYYKQWPSFCLSVYAQLCAVYIPREEFRG